MRSWRISAAFLGGLLACTATVFGDVAFPARLDVAEREAGIYDITFTLPIVEGRKLRAEPQMPPNCIDDSPREAGASSGGYTATWSVRCEPASLAGEAIVVEGLLGTQTDLAFSLTTLDGRIYSEILRPSRPGFLVPVPPSPAALATAAVIEGVRRVLRQPGLWLLVVAVSLLGARLRLILAAGVWFAVGHLVAQWLGGLGWLEVAPQTRDVLIWASVAIPAIRLAADGVAWEDRSKQLWPAALFLGLILGGARPEALPTDGLSSVEQTLVLMFFAIGVGGAAVLMAVAAGELRAVLTLVGGGRWRPAVERVFGYGAGGLAVGLVLANFVGMATRYGNAPRAPLELVLLAAVLGPNIAVARRARSETVFGFTVLAAAGMAAGLLRLPLPGASLLVLGSLVVLGAALALNKPLTNRWLMIVTAIGVVAHAWSTALALVENVSRAAAVTVGVVVVAVFVFYAGLELSRGLRPGKLTIPMRAFGAGVALLAVAWRVGEYRVWFEREVATEAALGLARIPVLAIGVAIVAIVLWPRRRRVASEFGLEKGGPGTRHWVVLVTALFLVPYGTVAISNPFFEPRAPRGDDARRVASRVLSDTYFAFNLVDESELFDTLAASVTGDLVDDLFLDGRRRLTAGTREGTRVTVRDVSVLEIGEPFGGATAEEGFSYECSWAVVARVQHLQHVHHRQNLYNGVVTLQSADGKWKIAGVELVSEDRVVVPWKPT